MKAFIEYKSNFSLDLEISMLDLSLRDSEYCILSGSAPLQTPSGKPFSGVSERLLRHILTDLQLNSQTEVKDFSSALLFSFCRDVLMEGADPIADEWNTLVSLDPFVRIKTSGRSSLQPYEPDDPLFAFSFNSLAGLLGTVNHYAGKLMSEVSLEDSELNPFKEILRMGYERMSFAERVCFHAVSSIHQSGIVLPILLILGALSPAEYAKGLIALRIRDAGDYPWILADVAVVQAYLVSSSGLVTDTNASSLIRQGEGDSIEFKSTLRWDIRAGKSSQAIERASLKTISAFLNSQGGSLLIGVRDDGSIEGIETDKFANEDKFLLHLWTLIRTCLGRDVCPHVRTRLEKKDEKTVCIVKCFPAGRPVFLRQPGFNEELYIRVGPSSNAIDISEALRYIKDRFPTI